MPTVKSRQPGHSGRASCLNGGLKETRYERQILTVAVLAMAGARSSVLKGSVAVDRIERPFPSLASPRDP